MTGTGYQSHTQQLVHASPSALSLAESPSGVCFPFLNKWMPFLFVKRVTPEQNTLETLAGILECYLSL